jgi:hypothetical protein
MTIAEDSVASPRALQLLLGVDELELPLGEIWQNRGENSVESSSSGNHIRHLTPAPSCSGARPSRIAARTQSVQQGGSALD